MSTLSLAAAQLKATITGQIPIGLNTYCLRAMRWNDAQLIDYAASLKLDAIFLQDSLDPEINNPEHWRRVKEMAGAKGLHLETGIGAIMPKTPAEFDTQITTIRKGVDRAKAMGATMMRCLIAPDREHFPPGPIEQHMETAVKLLRSVRSYVMDAGLKVAIENHKDLQSWETRQVIEAAGKEFVGSYLDTGNPVFVLEDPMTTLENLGPYALCVHLRDSAIYEHEGGVAVQWVPLGEGVVDFKAFIARMREVAPPVYVYIKPITGRPPQTLAYLHADFWERYPKARAADLARFIALAKKGRPYELPMVIEDLPGKPIPPDFLPAVQYQQREHMERSIAYGEKVLDLGIKWRTVA